MIIVQAHFIDLLRVRLPLMLSGELADTVAILNDRTELLVLADRVEI